MARSRSRKVFRDGKVYVCKVMCQTCIFRPGNPMDLHPGRVEYMVAEATRRESCIPCHETTGTNQKQAVCRGFFELHRTGPLQIAERLGYIEFQ